MGKLPKFEAEYLLTAELKTREAILSYEKLSLGQQIKKLRQKARMKQKELARKLSTSQSAIARIENGKQNLSIKMLVNITHLLGKKLFIRIQ